MRRHGRPAGWWPLAALLACTSLGLVAGLQAGGRVAGPTRAALAQSDARAAQGVVQQPTDQQTPFRAGVDVVSLNVTVTDGTLRHRSRGRGLRGLRGRRQAGAHASSPVRSSRSRCRCCSTAARAWRTSCRRPGGSHQLRQASEPERHGPGDRLRQPRRDPPGVHERARARASHPQNRRRAAPHRCTTRSTSRSRSSQDQGDSGDEIPPAGARRALLGRRRHVEPDLVRRGARARQANRDGHLHDRAASAEADGTQSEASTRPSS